MPESDDQPRLLEECGELARARFESPLHVQVSRNATGWRAEVIQELSHTSPFLDPAVPPPHVGSFQMRVACVGEAAEPMDALRNLVEALHRVPVSGA